MDLTETIFQKLGHNGNVFKSGDQIDTPTKLGTDKPLFSLFYCLLMLIFMDV